MRFETCFKKNSCRIHSRVSLPNHFQDLLMQAECNRTVFNQQGTMHALSSTVGSISHITEHLLTKLHQPDLGSDAYKSVIYFLKAQNECVQ